MGPEIRVSMLIAPQRKPVIGGANHGPVCCCKVVHDKVEHDILCRLAREFRSGSSARPSKLTKPPKVQIPRKRPVRNRLQRHQKAHAHKRPSTTVYVLKYESYPYTIEDASILGVFKTIDAASTAALLNGAYAFSRNGLNDGMEYLTSTGRIRILEHDVCTSPRRRGSISQRDGHPLLPISPTNALDRIIALRNFTQPEGSAPRRPSSETYRPSPHRPTYIALHKSSAGMACLGVFGERIKAWNACLKHHVIETYDHDIQDEMRWMDENGHPHVQAKIAGGGRHCWDVVAFKIDEVVKGAQLHVQEPTWRDI